MLSPSTAVHPELVEGERRLRAGLSKQEINLSNSLFILDFAKKLVSSLKKLAHFSKIPYGARHRAHRVDFEKFI